MLINGSSQGIFTVEAYKELRLLMSTGDFHVHETNEHYVSPDDEGLLHLVWHDQEPQFSRLGDN